MKKSAFLLLLGLGLTNAEKSVETIGNAEYVRSKRSPHNLHHIAERIKAKGHRVPIKASKSAKKSDGFTTQATPSMTPTSHSSRPTRSPTFMPTFDEGTLDSQGWVYSWEYQSGSDCVGTPVWLYMNPINQCVITYNGAGEATGSFEYQCGNAATVTYYSDSACTIGEESYELDLGCTVYAYYSSYMWDDDYWSSNTEDMFCSSSTTIEYPSSGTYSVISSYDEYGGFTGTCPSNLLVEVDAVLNNFCQTSNGGTSELWNFPNYYSYSDSTTCSTTPTVTALPQTCVGLNYENPYYTVNDDFMSYSMFIWSSSSSTPSGPTPHPSAVPTVPGATPRPTTVPTDRPSHLPTPAPTEAQTYAFTVAQNIAGISESTYNSDTSTNNAVIQMAAQKAMPQLSTEDIVVTGVVAATSRRLSESDSSTDAIVATYVVNYNLCMLDMCNDPTAAYDSLTGELYYAVVSTTLFTTYLEQFSAEIGATDMEGTSSNSYTATTYTQTTTDSVDDDNSSGGGGGSSNTAGIAAGVVVAVVVLAGLGVAYYMYTKGMLCGGAQQITATRSAGTTGTEAGQTATANPMAAAPAVTSTAVELADASNA